MVTKNRQVVILKANILAGVTLELWNHNYTKAALTPGFSPSA